MTIQIKGLKRFQHFTIKLSPKLNKEIMSKATEFSRFVQKSAKLRAPRFSGYLASSIFVKKLRNEILLKVTAPYAQAQEFGKGLPHYVSRKKLSPWFGASRTRGGRRFAGSLPPKKGMVVVSRYKPFIQPALERGIAKLPGMLINGTKQAIKKAGG